MGWWKIDPETGQPTKATSKISRPGSVSLNAIPGIDDDSEACYTGDAPWDAAYAATNELRELLGESAEFTPEEAERLISDRIVPGWVEPGQVGEVLRVIDAMWVDVDDCYEDDWGRKARPVEKRAAGGQAVQYLIGDEDVD